MGDTIAAIATGAVVSAIGIVRLSGDKSIDIIDRLFFPASGRKMSSYAPHALVYGELRSISGEAIDSCLCTYSRAPKSYTGEDTAELQCHGSPVVLRAALEEIFAQGARQAGPGEFTKRAFLNGRLELTAAEAVADIIEADSIETAKNAAAQLGGAIGRRSEAVYSSLVDISSHYHAVLDYPDEDIEDFRLSAYIESIDGAINSLERLLDTFERGRFMKEGIPAVIVGRPNAGKSSLLNALLGYDRAIVTSVPGTTRDTIEEKLRLGGVCLRLTDTAGIRDTEDEVERIGVERSRSAMEQAQLVIAVIDASGHVTQEDIELVRLTEEAPKGILVFSKMDLSRNAAPVDTALPVLSLSAVTGEGLDRLEEAIRGLFPMPQVPAGEILTNSRQAEAIGRALDSMKAAKEAMLIGATPDIVLTETETAMAALGELSGRTIREDITNRIFERFCVGK